MMTTASGHGKASMMPELSLTIGGTPSYIRVCSTGCAVLGFLKGRKELHSASSEGERSRR